jgi:hypothetical protein
MEVGEEEQQVFHGLKQLMGNYATEAMLIQEDDSVQDRVIQYVSHQLSGP